MPGTENFGFVGIESEASTSSTRRCLNNLNGRSYRDGILCRCCPYGYHIDLDFVPFSEKMLSGEGREGDVGRIQALKDKWRSERQSMDQLLGVLKGRNRNSEHNDVGTLSRATVDIWDSLKFDEPLEYLTPQYFELEAKGLDYVYGDALDQAVTDFEEALFRSRPQGRFLSYDIPDSQKYHTFPRLKGPVLRDLDMSPTSLVLRTETSRPNLTFDGSMFSNWSSKHTITATHSVLPEARHSIDRNLNDDKIAALEEQVKLIPPLQEKLALVTAEKNTLLRRVEAESEKRELKPMIGENLNNIFRDANELNNNTVINGRIEAQNLISRRDVSVHASIPTRDFGISHIMPKTRSIGVGGCTELSSVWEIGRLEETPSPGGKSPCGTLRRRTRTFDTGVQVNQCELDESKTFIPVLQIVEKVDFGAQITMDTDTTSVQPIKVYSVKSVGITAKPRMSDIGLMQKPDQRDAKCNTADEQKVRTRSVGVTALLDVRSPVEDRVQMKKSVRSTGSNTDKLKSRTVSLSTTELTAYITNSTQTIPMKEDAAGEQEESGDFIKTRKAKKKGFSLPVSSQNLPDAGSTFASFSEPSTKGLSRIPRLASPASPVSSPKFASKPILEESGTAGIQSKLDIVTEKSVKSLNKPSYERSNTYTKDMEVEESENCGEIETFGEETHTQQYNAHSPIPERREKAKPSKEMQGALKVLNDALLRGKKTDKVTSAISVILHEWFRVAGTKTADPLDVEDYLDMFENYSPQLLRYIVNMPDGNGNTAMHYAVSHGNFDIVSILLDSKVCEPNKANKAGYTSVMLVSLAKVLSDTHRHVVRRLFSGGDVNIKAAQHGQTALMLAASHGRLDTVKLLLESGANINIQDEDGSTALMCASEHGHGEIVKFLLTQADCDPNLTDNDGSTALSVAMEANHKDIGVMLYAHMHFVKGYEKSPATSKNETAREIEQSDSPQSTPGSSSAPSPFTSTQTSPVSAKKHSSPKDAWLS